MERVVYFLGAGFSAPLGIPVMSNFILKAKDMYFSNTEKYEHFKDVFDVLDRMSVIKNYFSADLFNIEEVLSILEMNDFLNNGSEKSDKFKDFINDVISYYTPNIKKYSSDLPSNWERFIFGENWMSHFYGVFVANLLSAKVVMDKERTLNWEINKGSNISYSVVSFNYDRVLESFVDSMKDSGYVSNEVDFNTEYEHKIPNQTLLHKLHGSVDKQNIVPPTWNKYSNQDLYSTWQNAWQSITHANQIRIIGYSLPVSDSYIKYFLKASIYRSKHLKSIDVITLDNSESQEVKKRYDEFIDFNYFRYKNADVYDFLSRLGMNMNKNGDSIKFDSLEYYHNDFMEQ